MSSSEDSFDESVLRVDDDIQLDDFELDVHCTPPRRKRLVKQWQRFSSSPEQPPAKKKLNFSDELVVTQQSPNDSEIDEDISYSNPRLFFDDEAEHSSDDDLLNEADEIIELMGKTLSENPLPLSTTEGSDRSFYYRINNELDEDADLSATDLVPPNTNESGEYFGELDDDVLFDEFFGESFDAEHDIILPPPVEIVVPTIPNTEYITAGDHRLSGVYINEEVFVVNKTTIIQAPMGLGKTEACARFLSNLNEASIGARNTPVKTLAIVNRKSLASIIATKLGCVDYQVVHPRSFRGEQSYTVCINSIFGCVRYIKDFDVVVLDELAGTLSMIFSSLMQQSARAQALSILHNLLNPNITGESRTVIVMDATMSERELEFIKDSCAPDNVSMVVYHPSTDLFALPEVTFEPSMGNFLHEMARSILCSNDKIVIATCAKEYIGLLLKLININCPDLLSKLGIRGEDMIRPNPRWLYFDAGTSKALIDRYLNDQELFKNHDVFIFSPVFVSGVSITVKWFDRMFALGQIGTVDAPEFVQMLKRVRHLSKNEIQVHMAGKAIDLHFNLDLPTVTEMLRNFQNQPEGVRDYFMECLGQRRGANPAVRDTFQTTLTQYFQAHPPAYQEKAYAHTCIRQLLSRSDPRKALQQAMKLNHPRWNLLDSLKERRYTDLDKTCLTALLNLHAIDLGDIISTRTEAFLVSQPESLNQKVEAYCISGIHDLVNLSPIGSLMKSCLSWIKTNQVQDLVKFASPFSLWYHVVSAFMTYGNGCTFEDDAVFYNVIVDMFKALKWDRHLLSIKLNRNTCLTVVSIDITAFHLIQFDTVVLFSRWKPLAEWSQKYQGALAMRGIESLSDNICSGKNVTRMSNSIMKVLGICGFEFLDEGPTISGKNKRSRRNIKSIHSQAINICTREEQVNFPDFSTYSQMQMAMYKYAIDASKAMRMLDVACRLGIKYHIPVGGSSKTLNNISTIGVFNGASVQNIRTNIPHAINVAFRTVFQGLYDVASEYIETPSYWFVENSTDYQCMVKFERFYRAIRSAFEQTARQLSVQANHV